jgi:hypothetical protein
MSCVIADSRPESLTLIAAQHEDWIIQQAITLLETISVIQATVGETQDFSPTVSQFRDRGAAGATGRKLLALGASVV